MQGVTVAVEAIEQRLVGAGVEAVHDVGGAIGERPGGRRPAVATPAPFAGDEEAGAGGPPGVAVGVANVGFEYDECRLALVVDCGDASLTDCRAFGGERLVKGDVLLAVEQSGEVEIAEVDTPTAAEDDDLRGERLLGGCRGVLRGELEFEPGRHGLPCTES